MNAHGKTLDKTFLSIDQAEDRGFIHRDYIAHCLRWTHVVKRLYERKCYQTARILDVGCGRELPLAKLLYSSKLIPQHYYGVDAGLIEDSEFEKINKTGKFPATIWSDQNFLELKLEDLQLPQDFLELKQSRANIVTCFEVLEHVEPAMMIAMLEHMRELTTDDARFFISTPCWNRVDCAANHVNEMLYEALGAAFERHGFVAEHVYGTFASIRDYERFLGGDVVTSSPSPHYTQSLRQIFTQLREYYDTNFLSCVFAPLFPAQSRNCLWELRKDHDTQHSVDKFPSIQNIQRPWSSSAKWEEMSL